MSSLAMVNTSAGNYQNNTGDGINAIFEEYANKLLEYENITEEVEWNELTASEFVTSIQTTIGNIIFIPKYMKASHMDFPRIIGYEKHCLKCDFDMAMNFFPRNFYILFVCENASKCSVISKQKSVPWIVGSLSSPVSSLDIKQHE